MESNSEFRISKNGIEFESREDAKFFECFAKKFEGVNSTFTKEEDDGEVFYRFKSSGKLLSAFALFQEWITNSECDDVLFEWEEIRRWAIHGADISSVKKALAFWRYTCKEERGKMLLYKNPLYVFEAKIDPVRGIVEYVDNKVTLYDPEGNNPKEFNITLEPDGMFFSVVLS